MGARRHGHAGKPASAGVLFAHRLDYQGVDVTDFEFDVREIPLIPPIGVLIDAGVNRGQFAAAALPWFKPVIYRGFEPLPDLWWAAGAVVSGIPNASDEWLVIDAALGEECCGRPMRRNYHDPSSSLLPLGPGASLYGIPMVE